MILPVGPSLRREMAGSARTERFLFGNLRESLTLADEASPVRVTARASIYYRYPNPTSGRASPAGAPFFVQRSSRRVYARHARPPADLRDVGKACLACPQASMQSAPDLQKDMGLSCTYKPFCLPPQRPPFFRAVICPRTRSAPLSGRPPEPLGRPWSMETCLPAPQLELQPARFAMMSVFADPLTFKRAAQSIDTMELATGAGCSGGYLFSAYA